MRTRGQCRRRLSRTLFAALACSTGAVGCTTHECDGDMMCIDQQGTITPISQATDCKAIMTGGKPIQGYRTAVVSSTEVDDAGNMVTTLNWWTSTLNGPWLDFPGERTYVIALPEDFLGPDVTLYAPNALVSDDNPMQEDASHSNLISGAGYLAEFEHVGDNGTLQVFNGSCTEYALQVQLTAVRTVPANAASATLDATLPDASQDASSEMSTADALDASAPDAADASATTDSEAGP